MQTSLMSSFIPSFDRKRERKQIHSSLNLNTLSVSKLKIAKKIPVKRAPVIQVTEVEKKDVENVAKILLELNSESDARSPAQSESEDS